MRPQQQQRKDVVQERAAFVEEQKRLDAAGLVFVDEAGVLQGMRLAYGYAPRGERCVENAPFRTGKRQGLIGWMAAAGGEIVHFQGTVTAEVFEHFVRVHQVPSLEVGDIVNFQYRQPLARLGVVARSRPPMGNGSTSRVPSGVEYATLPRSLDTSATGAALHWGREPAQLLLRT